MVDTKNYEDIIYGNRERLVKLETTVNAIEKDITLIQRDIAEIKIAVQRLTIEDARQFHPNSIINNVIQYVIMAVVAALVALVLFKTGGE